MAREIKGEMVGTRFSPAIVEETSAPGKAGAMPQSGAGALLEKIEVILPVSNLDRVETAPKTVLVAWSERELLNEVGQVLVYKAGITTPLVLRLYQGVITLRGQVPNEASLGLAEQLVLALPGVKGIVSGFTVNGPIATGAGSLTSQPSPAPVWFLPRGEASIQENGVVYATNGKIGRVKGLVFHLSGGAVQDLIVERHKGLVKGWRRLSFGYIEDGFHNSGPEIYLKVNRADFEEVSEEMENLLTISLTGQTSQIISFGKKTIIHYPGEKPGWLAGVLHQHVGAVGSYSRYLSHYLWKTAESLKTLLLPFQSLAPKSNGREFYLEPDGVKSATRPNQFNGFGAPGLVVERVVEKLALTRAMQVTGSYLRVSYREGEVTVEGKLRDRSALPSLTTLMEQIPGVRRVNNLVEAVQAS